MRARFLWVLPLLACSVHAQTDQLVLPVSQLESATQTVANPAAAGFFSDLEIARILAQGPWPKSMPPDPGNQLSGLSWAESLGKRLFNDSDLSANRRLSCASCHLPQFAFTDGRRVARGEQEHQRNTQGLLNAGLQRWFGWGGGTDSLWAASLRPVLSPVEMAADITVVARRVRDKADIMQILSDNLPDSTDLAVNDQALLVMLAKAIAAYTRTLQSGETAFDQYRTALESGDTVAQSRYPESARRGLRLFVGEGNCHVCHFGPDFSNGEFHDTGRPFFIGIGQVDAGRYSGIKRVRQDPYNLAGEFSMAATDNDLRKLRSVVLSQQTFGQWRTPSLRNLTLTAPYMHDGSLPDLRAVVDSYAEIDTDRLHANGESILQPQTWSDQQRQDLVEFLRSLSIEP